MIRAVTAVLAMLVAVSSLHAQQKTREQLVREDKQKVEEAGFWMYNDLPGAIAKAKETGKPILVVLRCIPCHECVKLDDELVDTDPVIRPLLEKYVCVRIVGTNGLDLTTFQYDTDQSFAVFMLNADGTIYGRFGTRSHRTEWVGDVSLQGMGKALKAGLDLHAGYPANKDMLAGKRGPAPEVTSPEKFPALKDKFTSKLNYEGDVVKSCIHCHQIGDAQRAFYWQDRKAIPEKVMFPFPHPRTVGLTMDPKEMASILEVAPGSSADKAGLKAGDQIESMNGQPLVSIADLQWVLHNASPDGAKVPATVRRGSGAVDVTLELTKGWRQADDISWRVTSWGLRGTVGGGMYLENISADERKGLPENAVLRVRSVGQYGIHGTAKKAGIQAGDVLVSYDGRSDFKREADVHFYAVTHRHPGDRVDVKVLRNGKTLTFKLPMQE